MKSGGARRALKVVVVSRDEARSGTLSTALSISGFDVIRPSEVRRESILAPGGLVVLDEPRDYAYAAETCRHLRAIDSTARILAVTVARSSIARAIVLESGADQILSAPFSTRELLATVWTLVRREGRGSGKAVKLTSAAAKATPEKELRTVMGIRPEQLARPLGLTQTERRLLALLADAAGPVSATIVLNTVFADTHHGPDSSLVRVHMHRLRKKLIGAGLTVVGVQGWGYSLESVELRQGDAAH